MTIKFKKYLKILIASFFISFFIFNISMAANDYSLGVFAKKAGYPTSGAKASLEGSIQLVINVVLSLSGILFLILAVYAGVRWMSAQGNSEAVTKAQETLQAAIIGLVVVSMSYAITGLIFTSLQNKVPTNNGVPDVVVACTKDGDCQVGEKCSPLGACYSSNCSDPVNQCGGGCATKCALNQTCVILNDCISGNCTNGKCAAKITCSSFNTLETCPGSCDWGFLPGTATQACLNIN